MESQLTGRREMLKTLAAGSAAAALVMALGSSKANAAEKFPHITDAIKALKVARKDLDEGAKIFGGHRVSALKAIDLALDELNSALKFAEGK